MHAVKRPLKETAKNGYLVYQYCRHRNNSLPLWDAQLQLRQPLRNTKLLMSSLDFIIIAKKAIADLVHWRHHNLTFGIFRAMVFQYWVSCNFFML